jgi:hypothetical protein
MRCFRRATSGGSSTVWRACGQRDEWLVRRAEETMNERPLEGAERRLDTIGERPRGLAIGLAAAA